MIKLYGSPRSSAGRCVWVLEEAGIVYSLQEVDMKNKEHKSEAYLKINPMGKVPAMVDGDVILFESMAINYYIAEKYKNELLGKSDREKGLTMQWSFWSTSELQPPIIEIFIQKVFMPDHKRDHSIIENNLKKIPLLLKVLNDSLHEKKYLSGENFTIGDINTASVVSICPMIGIDLAEYPNVNNWLNLLQARPAFLKYQALRK